MCAVSNHIHEYQRSEGTWDHYPFDGLNLHSLTMKFSCFRLICKRMSTRNQKKRTEPSAIQSFVTKKTKKKNGINKKKQNSDKTVESGNLVTKNQHGLSLVLHAVNCTSFLSHTNTQTPTRRHTHNHNINLLKTKTSSTHIHNTHNLLYIIC